MARRDIKKTVLSLEEQLAEMIPKFNEAKKEERRIKTEVATMGAYIKQSIKQLGLRDFNVGDTRATITEIDKTEFNELHAIEILRNNLKPGLFNQVVKHKEYIDDYELEAAINEGKIDASILQPAFIKLDSVISLRLKQIKE